MIITLVVRVEHKRTKEVHKIAFATSRLRLASAKYLPMAYYEGEALRLIEEREREPRDNFFVRSIEENRDSN